MRPVGSCTKMIVDFMQAPLWVRFLGKLTGIQNLTIDKNMFGGGPFSIHTGGFLSLHTDFNKHVVRGKVVTPGWRRVNVLLYLNEGWQEEHGGSFELWRTNRNYQMLDYVAKIVPTFNRLAIFSVTDVSIHGHLDSVNHPKGDTRKSISMYYYTPTVDDEPLITQVQHESLYMPDFQGTRSRRRWRKAVPRFIVR